MYCIDKLLEEIISCFVFLLSRLRRGIDYCDGQRNIMMNLRKNGKRSRGILLMAQGSILMETLLVLPIYLILLAGLFWCGDLVTGRSKLQVADHTLVYLRIQGSSSERDIFDHVFGTQWRNGVSENSFRNISSFLANSANGAQGVWWQEFQISGEMMVSQPAWLESLAKINRLLFPDTATGSGLESVNNLRMHSRDTDKGFTQSVYGRSRMNDTGIRTLYGDQLLAGSSLGPPWRDVATENWPSTSRISLDSTRTVDRYIRTPGYDGYPYNRLLEGDLYWHVYESKIYVGGYPLPLRNVNR